MKGRLTNKQLDLCDSLYWSMAHFTGLCPTRVHPKRELDTAQTRGLAAYFGIGEKCDGDGFTIEPVRVCHVYILTPFGELMRARAYHEQEARGFLEDES